ncbi:MAG TPA: zf-HC2 domain-containing protein [Kofleriaceae bacterium]|nr:zf-HC2 domain-containing protein [Kofleriaceae bacterium]
MTPLGPFTCEDTARRLDDYLDRELDQADMQLVREHLERCAACAQEFRFEGSVIDNVKRKLRQIDLPEDLTTRIIAELERGKAPGT